MTYLETRNFDYERLHQGDWQAVRVHEAGSGHGERPAKQSTHTKKHIEVSLCQRPGSVREDSTEGTDFCDFLSLQTVPRPQATPMLVPVTTTNPSGTIHISLIFCGFSENATLLKTGKGRRAEEAGRRRGFGR
jgi:hypothetical protein